MTVKREINIGLIGLGTVGTGVWKILQENQKLIESRTGLLFTVKKVCTKDVKKKRSVSIPSDLLTSQAEEILQDSSIDMIVEVMGGVETAGKLVLSALEKGKCVVTANKALLAEKAGEIFRTAEKKGVRVGFEASVAGGIPIIQAVREGLVANKIQEIYGIINGTCNYILTEMSEKGSGFSQVLAQAQKEGYAEQDSSFDVKGIDASQKLALLIMLCYGVVPPKVQDGLYVEGIDQITALDIEFAKKLGYAIKLLAIAKEQGGSIEGRVHPTMVPVEHPLAEVKGVFNAAFLKGDAVGDMMLMGRGAGMMPTASAVVSDIARIGQQIANGSLSGDSTILRSIRLQSIDDLNAEYYLRFSVVDQPGVLAEIATHLGENGISIASVYQQERDEGSKVPIVVMTHRAKEKDIRKAISKIDNLKTVLDKTVLIRVEHFK